MSKRASERYTTVQDMAEDLRMFLHTVGGTGSPLALAVPIAAPRINPGSRSASAYLPAIRLRSATDQDRPEGAAIVR